MNKNSRWVFTDWNEPPTCKKEKLVYFIVWQREWTTTGKAHYQGYIEFINSYTRTQVKRLFGSKSIHLEEAKKSRSLNMFYCLKASTYAGERYIREGNTPDMMRHEKVHDMFPFTWASVRGSCESEDILKYNIFWS